MTRERLSTPIPDELRRRAIDLLSTHVMGRVVSALKVNHSMLKQWQGKFSAPLEPGFISLPNDSPELLSPTSSLQITLRSPLMRHTGISHDVKTRQREHVRDDAGHTTSAITDLYIDVDKQARYKSGRKKQMLPGD